MAKKVAMSKKHRLAIDRSKKCKTKVGNVKKYTNPRRMDLVGWDTVGAKKKKRG